LKPAIDDCEKFHVKALMKTSRRAPLGDPAEKQYFGTTRGTFAGVPWKFDQDAMILTMGGKEWPIVVLTNVRGTMGTRAFVKGPDGRRYNYLLVLDGKVGPGPS
jgi:hypothetical protein